MKNRTIHILILSFLVAVIIFSAGYILTPDKWLLYLIVSGGIFVGFTALLLLFQKKEKSVKHKDLDKYENRRLKEALKKGREKLEQISVIKDRINSQSVRQKINPIFKVTEDILKNIEQDPGDIDMARQFLGYYLDTCITLLNKYATLSEKRKFSDDIKDALKKIEDTLTELNIAFKKQYDKMLANNILDLEAEIKVLNQTLKLDGLSSEE